MSDFKIRLFFFTSVDYLNQQSIHPPSDQSRFEVCRVLSWEII